MATGSTNGHNINNN